MTYDNEMELHYPDDAYTFDVEIMIIHPETGENESAVVDNLTTAMYFIVGNNLLPIREGYDKKGEVHIQGGGKEEIVPGVNAGDLLFAYRGKMLHEIMLTITVEGDPALLEQLSE